MSWGSRRRHRAGALALALAGGLALSACSSGTVVRQSLDGTKTAAVAGCPAGSASSVTTCQQVLSSFRRVWSTFDQVWSKVPVRKSSKIPSTCFHVAPGVKAPEECQGDLPVLAPLVSVAAASVVYGYWGPEIIAPVMLAGDATKGRIEPLDPIVAYVGSKPPTKWPSPVGTLVIPPAPNGTNAPVLAVVKSCMAESLSVTHAGRPVPLVVDQHAVLDPGLSYNPQISVLEELPTGTWKLALYHEGAALTQPVHKKGVSPCGAGW
jgi:hypothetical protein